MNHEEEIKRMWNRQLAGQPAAAIDLARRDSGLFQKRIGRRNRREFVAGVIGVAAFAFHAWRAVSPLAQAGCLLVIAGTLFVLWQLQRRASAGEPPPAGLGLPTLEFHRRELARQRDALASAWRWYVLPIVPGLALLQVDGHLHAAAPLATLLAVDAFMLAVLGSIVWINRYMARKLQAEIEALDAA